MTLTPDQLNLLGQLCQKGLQKLAEEVNVALAAVSPEPVVEAEAEAESAPAAETPAVPQE